MKLTMFRGSVMRRDLVLMKAAVPIAAIASLFASAAGNVPDDLQRFVLSSLKNTSRRRHMFPMHN